MKKKNTLLLGLTCLFATASISAITVNVTNKTAKTISLQNAVTVYRTKTPEFRSVDSVKRGPRPEDRGPRLNLKQRTFYFIDF